MKLALLILFVFSAAAFVFGLGPLLFGLALAFVGARLMLRWVVMIPLLLALSLPAAGRADDLEDLPACQDVECDWANRGQL
jgi:hypothetical protein